jgi:predicted DNA-binding transcriptional regulator YafY
VKTDRLISLLSLLRTQWRVTARSLSETLGVSERTVYRDLDDLVASGIPLSSYGGPGGGYFLDEAYRVNLGALSSQDLQSLFLPSGPMPQEVLGRGNPSALLKLLASLPPKSREQVDRIRQRFFFDPAPWFLDPESEGILRPLERAVWNDSLVEITYRSVKEAKTRTVEAWALVVKVGVWYLIAKEAGAPMKGMKTYRLSRILSLAVQEQRFSREKDFLPSRYWTSVSKEFEETLSKESRQCLVLVAVPTDLLWYFPSYLEGRYRTVDSLEDGRIRVELTFSSEDAARRHLLGLGGHIEVLSPETLKDSLILSAKGVLARYGRGDPVVEPRVRNPMP